MSERDQLLDDLAHELWAASQLAPGEGIEDGVDRIVWLLEYSTATNTLIDLAARHGELIRAVDCCLGLFHDDSMDGGETLEEMASVLATAKANDGNHGFSLAEHDKMVRSMERLRLAQKLCGLLDEPKD